MELVKNNVFFSAFIVCIFATCLASISILNHVVTGDAPSYLEAMHVMQGGDTPVNFVPNRILTSSLGIESVSVFTKIFGSVEVGWLVLDIMFFVVLGIVFYKLVFNIFESERTALLSSLFLITNYAMIVFGLDYGMDIGGWTFYVVSLYFTLKYVRTGANRALLFSALAIGVGVLFKEYALLGAIPVVAILVYENWQNPLAVIKKGIVPAVIALTPLFIVYLIVYLKFNYTYADWLSYGNASYVYSSKIMEYIKSFGSLYNFLSLVVIAGVYCFVRYRNNLLPGNKMQIFVVSVVVSAMPVFIWPAITQRILFITVPAAILVASFAFKKYEKYWVGFLLLLIVYALVNFTMDSCILPNVNIGPVLDAIMGK